ncbi:MAG: IS1182 family transposase [Bacteroidota bacterium]
MKRRKPSQPKFKENDPHQLSLLPPSLEGLIPENHVVRVVQSVLDKVKLESIMAKYKGGGTSSYHPRMLLKVPTYGYLSNVYSSRKLEDAVSSNIHFMWLAGMQRPDHNTLNRFRSERLKGVFKEVFAQVVQLLMEEGLVSLEKVFTDGTKLEASANRYTFVWGKSVRRSRKRIGEQLEELWAYAEGVAAEEMRDNRPSAFEEVDAEKVEQAIGRINEALKDKKVDKKVRQKLAHGKKNWPVKLREYGEKERILDGRNSYSKTDPDATFMRMKEDHMGNGQLKPGYNWQVSTSGQYILNYGIYHSPTDTLTFCDHIGEFEQLYGQLPTAVTADAGYGSQENYAFLEEREIEGYVKYPSFHREQKKNHRSNPFHPDNLFYSEAGDFLVCPVGQRMERCSRYKRQTKSGFEQAISVYRARNCEGCPVRGQCHKSKENREISLNHGLRRHKAIMRQRLLSDKGVEMRKQRPADVEATFGNIKHNKKFRRLSLRGKDKVLVEVGLIALAHNLAKMAN